MDWQRRAVLAVYDNPHGTRRAIISVGRKSGKTTFAACLLLAHLAGPVAVANGQLYSTALSRDQAALLYGLAAKIVRLSPRLSDAIVCKDGIKQLVCPSRGTVYKALSAEATTAHGLSPAFVVHDELGQVRGPRSELYEALETAGSAQLQPLSIVISTQACDDQSLLSVLIDDALAGHVALETIKAANPSIGVFQNPDEVLAMAEDARRMPAREAAFRNLVLNQRVEASSPFIMPVQWQACAGAPLDLTVRDVFQRESRHSGIGAFGADSEMPDPRIESRARPDARCARFDPFPIEWSGPLTYTVRGSARTLMAPSRAR